MVPPGSSFLWQLGSGGWGCGARGLAFEAPFRPTPFQAPLVLQTNLPFRLILYGISL